MNIAQLKSLTSSQFRRITGVKPRTFYQMLQIIKASEKQRLDGETRGRDQELSLESQLLLSLWYLRHYTTFLFLGLQFGVSEATACRIAIKIENILIKSKDFHLPGKKKLSQSDLVRVITDATESRIQRPTKGQRHHYSGKKKYHTTKTQIIIESVKNTIQCMDFSNGKKHDKALYDESKVKLKEETDNQVDSGYQGIQKTHNKTTIPMKKPKGRKLTKEEKRENRKRRKGRMIIEHVIRMLKRFRVVSDVYRNRRKRFGLRMNLIGGIYNYELAN